MPMAPSMCPGARGRPADDGAPSSLAELLASGALVRTPIVYEDFLPRSAAGIFASNLDSAGSRDSTREGAPRDEGWLADAMGRVVHDPMELYAAQQQASLDAAAAALRIPALTAPS